jgi:7-carboxy-7-deazaguanine synthase
LVGSSCKLFLQPEWSRFEKIIPFIVDYVKANPEWRISLQVHKYMHIP